MRGLTKASAPTGSVRRARGFPLAVRVCEFRTLTPWRRRTQTRTRHAATLRTRFPCRLDTFARTGWPYALLRVHGLSGKHDLRFAPSTPPLLLFGPRPKPDYGPTVHGTHKQRAFSRSFARAGGSRRTRKSRSDIEGLAIKIHEKQDRGE